MFKILGFRVLRLGLGLRILGFRVCKVYGLRCLGLHDLRFKVLRF